VPVIDQIWHWLGPPTPHRLAAGTYGLVIGGAVLVAAGGDKSVVVTIIEVCVSLLVYWMAEVYAEFLGHNAAGARLALSDTALSVRRGLAMIKLSVLPLAALAIAAGAGVSLSTAITVALAVTAGLLTGLGLVAGWQQKFSLLGRIGTAAGAGATGALMIGLKVALH
jgi:hypothetical protein